MNEIRPMGSLEIGQGTDLDNAILLCLLLKVGKAITFSQQELLAAMREFAGTVSITDKETMTVLVRVVTHQEGQEIQTLHSADPQGKPS